MTVRMMMMIVSETATEMRIFRIRSSCASSSKNSSSASAHVSSTKQWHRDVTTFPLTEWRSNDAKLTSVPSPLVARQCVVAVATRIKRTHLSSCVTVIIDQTVREHLQSNKSARVLRFVFFAREKDCISLHQLPPSSRNAASHDRKRNTQNRTSWTGSHWRTFPVVNATSTLSLADHRFRSTPGSLPSTSAGGRTLGKEWRRWRHLFLLSRHQHQNCRQIWTKEKLG